jgi:hypothetical protein
MLSAKRGAKRCTSTQHLLTTNSTSNSYRCLCLHTQCLQLLLCLEPRKSTSSSDAARYTQHATACAHNSVSFMKGLQHGCTTSALTSALTCHRVHAARQLSSSSSSSNRAASTGAVSSSSHSAVASCTHVPDEHKQHALAAVTVTRLTVTGGAADVSIIKGHVIKSLATDPGYSAGYPLCLCAPVYMCMCVYSA